LFSDELKLSIAKRIVAGSVGKGTGIPGSDYDLVVYLNNELPPFESVLVKLKKKLEGLPGFKFERSTPYTIKFQVDGMKFDLLPAVNFVVGAAAETYNAQLNQTLQRAKESNIRDFNHNYSSSLAQFAVEFVSGQTEDMRSVVRLAKFWNKMVDLKGVYVSGRSTIIEVIAIASSSNQTNKKKPKGNARSVMSRFTLFLISMAQFSTLNITEYVNQGNLQPDPRVQMRLPFIRDPSNPNNNLVHNIKPEVINTFEAAAVCTLKKIDALYLNEVNPDIKALINPMD